MGCCAQLKAGGRVLNQMAESVCRGWWVIVHLVISLWIFFDRPLALSLVCSENERPELESSQNVRSQLANPGFHVDRRHLTHLS